MSIRIMINEEYRQITPDLPSSEYEALKDDIKKRNGNKVPILVNQHGVILDGHNRYRACLELGLEPYIVVKVVDDPLEEKELVIVLNATRRHYNAFQRAEQGFQLEAIYAERARRRMLAGMTLGPNDPKGKTEEIVAKQIGIPATAYRRARKIILEGTENAKERARTGKSTIFKEFQKILVSKRRDEMVKKGPSMKLPGGCQLIHGDFMSGWSWPHEKVDVIFTDPPYGQGAAPVYGDLATLANYCLKPGGSLICFVGHVSLESVILQISRSIEAMPQSEDRLRYWWIIAMVHSGPTSKVYDRNVIAKFKPLLWYVRGKHTVTNKAIRDVIISEKPDKSLHDWAQSVVEAKELIEALTFKGGLVLDPFMGSATTAMAALELGRQVICIESDLDRFNVGRSRIGETFGVQ